MADLVQITDHRGEAVARLLEQFKDKAKLAALIESLVGPLQGLEDAGFQLYLDRWLDSAEGVNLDNLGDIVQQPRLGFTDSQYRNWIKARIRVNLSNGHVDDMLTIAELVMGDAVGLEETEEYPAGMTIRVVGFNVDALTVFDILNDAKPAGVSFVFEYAEFPADDTFTFSDTGAVVEGDTAKGFSDETETTGGHLAGALGE